MLTTFLLGTNNDSFDVDDDDDDGSGGGGGDDDWVGDGDDHDSYIGRLRSHSDNHFATYIRNNINMVFKLVFLSVSFSAFGWITVVSGI